jgi:hypothetical protein
VYLLKGALVLLGGVRRADEVDLRGCEKLTDLTLMACVAQKGKQFLFKTMNLANYSITDVGLNWLSEGCKLLTTVNLDNCKEVSHNCIILLHMYVHTFSCK